MGGFGYKSSAGNSLYRYDTQSTSHFLTGVWYVSIDTAQQYINVARQIVTIFMKMTNGFFSYAYDFDNFGNLAHWDEDGSKNHRK